MTSSSLPASLVRRLELRISVGFLTQSVVQSDQEQPVTVEAQLIRKLPGETTPCSY